MIMMRRVSGFTLFLSAYHNHNYVGSCVSSCQKRSEIKSYIISQFRVLIILRNSGSSHITTLILSHIQHFNITCKHLSASHHIIIIINP